MKKPIFDIHDKTNQLDFFVTYLTDIPLRDQKDTMERPFFSLAKTPRVNPIEYTSPDGGLWVRVEGIPRHGIATIWDADILIWAVSQVMEMVNHGQTPERTIRFHPYDLLKAIGRGTTGRDYERLRAALARLHSTSVSTNIRAGGYKKTAMFHWLEGWREITNEGTGKTMMMEMTIPNWLYRGVLARGGALAIHQDYFQLTGGLDRWLYRVARKHAGNQEQGFGISLPTLYEKSGVVSRYRQFKYDLKKVVDDDQLPDYRLEWIEEGPQGEPAVFMIRREKALK